MKVYSIEQALIEVRKKYPTATKEGSTFDYSFWVDGKVVALAICKRKAKQNVWDLTIYSEPKVQ